MTHPLFRFLFLRARIACSLAILVATLGGCATVAPYEREYLARPGMDVEREGREARFRSHVYDSRAAAMGSSETSGGGCGCN